MRLRPPTHPLYPSLSVGFAVTDIFYFILVGGWGTKAEAAERGVEQFYWGLFGGGDVVGRGG